MESPPLLIVKSRSIDECEQIIENARSEDIFSADLVTTKMSSDGNQFCLFEIDTTEPEEMIRYCQSICSAKEDINLWCFMDEEPEQFLVNGRKGEVHTFVYEVEIDGTPCEEDTGSYGEWHRGLPDNWHYGAHAPSPKASDAAMEKLFEKICEALREGESVSQLLPEIRSAKNINIVNGDGQDAFTLAFDFGETSRPECVAVFEAMLDGGYNVHRVLHGFPFIARVFSVVSKAFLDRPVEQHSGAQRSRMKLGLDNDENVAYGATLKNMQAILDLTLRAGADINLGVEEYFGKDRNIKTIQDVEPADRDYASNEDRRFYIPIINAIAGHYYCPSEMYNQLIPYCTRETLEWVLEVDAYIAEDDIDSAIPAESIAEIREGIRS